MKGSNIIATATRPKHEFRRSCQALLWSAKGWSAKTIAAELEVCQLSVSSWLTAWQQKGLVGLMRQKGQGSKPILSISNSVHQQALKKAVSVHYQDAGRIKIDLEQALGQPMSQDTVKRFLKKRLFVAPAPSNDQTLPGSSSLC